jgi:alpha-N-arabinofuranosidase
MNHIKIDLERIVSDIDRNIFGGYLENLAYGGIYYPESPYADKDGLRTDVLSALNRWKLLNIRFPGGNFASNYHWKDAIGPLQDRPVTHNLAWNTFVSNRFGTDEFIKFCRNLNIAPYICVNCGDGDMREAADWVEYCNGTGNSSLVKLRRKNGFEEPYKVKFWGIGNEVDGPWQVGYKTPQEYARAATEFSKVMKRVDPDIKLVASAVSLWEDHPFPMFEIQSTEWVERTQLMLEQAGDYLDYLAIHRYANLNVNDPLENYMAFAADLDERLTAYEGLIRSVSLEKGIKHQINIAVDEYGVMRLPHIGRSEKMVVNLEDALMTGLYLNTFIRHARSVRLANFTPTLTALGVQSAHIDNPLLLESLFYPFELYSRTCGQLALDVFWYGDTFSGNYLNRSYTGIRTLDVTATLDEAHKQLVVYIVNQSKDEAMDTNISLASGQFMGNIKMSIVNGPDVKSENTYKNPNQVVTRETTLKASGKSLTMTFEPHSVTALVCAVK